MPTKTGHANRTQSKAHNKVTKCHTMLAKDSFLGSLLVFPIELWNGIAQKQGALMAIQTGCLGALHGSQSLTAHNRWGMLVLFGMIIKIMISTRK